MFRFRDSGIQGFRDSGIQGFRDSGIQGFRDIISEILDLSSNISIKNVLSHLITLVFISSCSFSPPLLATDNPHTEGVQQTNPQNFPQTNSQKASETSEDNKPSDPEKEISPPPKTPAEAIQPSAQPKTPAGDSPPQSKPPGSPVGPDSKAELDKFLGEMKPILEQATKVEAYLVGKEPATAEVPPNSQLGGYPVEEGPVVLKPEQTKIIQTLVLDGNSYHWGPPVKRCLFIPRVALRFIKGQKEVSILFSDYCGLASFAYQDKLSETSDYGRKIQEINGFLKMLFPQETP